MAKDEKTPRNLAKRLKELLEEDKQREAARLIERASLEVLGEHHFVYAREAALIAAVSLDAFDKWAERVGQIRMELDEQYDDAAKRIGDNDENI